MYLKIADRISPKKVAKLLIPDTADEDVDWDYENVYEWAYVDLPGVDFVLDVTRDHGMSDVPDEDLDRMTLAEIESLPSSGPTYIFGLTSKGVSQIRDIDEKLAQRISDALGMEVSLYPGHLDISGPDPQPIMRIQPKR